MAEPLVLAQILSRADMVGVAYYATLLGGWRAWLLRYGFFLCLGGAVVIAVALGAWLLLLHRHTPQAFAGYTMGVMGAIAVGLGAVLLQNGVVTRMIRAGASNGWDNRQISIGPDGVVEQWGQSEVRLSWADVAAVASAPGTTLLVTAEGEGWPIRHDSLPEGLSAVAFADRVANWRAAARTEA